MRPYAQIITDAREKLGLSDVDVANAVGTNYDSYFDLEHKNDEVDSTFPMTEICKLLVVLQLDPYEFFGIEPGSIVYSESESPIGLVVERLQSMLDKGISLREVAGWDIGYLIDDPGDLEKGPLDTIYEVGKFTGVPWFSIFLEIFNRTKATFSYPSK